MDEIALIHDAQGGDLNAFNRLVLAYQEMAYNYAYHILNDPHAAEDAAQTSFISAYRNLNTYRGGSFRAWLMRMVTNNCYDELRRQKRRPTTPLEPVTDDGLEENDSPVWMADSSPTPEEAAETSELQDAIHQCLDRLPDKFRSVVLMVEMEGFDYQEVAEAINKPIGTVKSRLARARIRLQNCLQHFRELIPERFRLEKEENA